MLDRAQQQRALERTLRFERAFRGVMEARTRAPRPAPARQTAEAEPRRREPAASPA